MSPALSTRFSGSARCSASRPRARCISWCWCGSCSSSWSTSRSCSRRGCCEPQPHLRRPRRRQLGRVLGLRRVDGGRGRRLGGRDAVHASPPARGAAGRLRAHRAAAAAVRAHRPKAGRVHRKGHLAVLLAQRRVPRHRRVPGAVDGKFVDYRLRINGLVENPVELASRDCSVAAPRADHPALLHPGLVGRRQMGRGVDADDHGHGQAAARGEMGGVLLPRRRRRRASTTTRTRSSR